jgi:2-keto-4-pentenoate hydratase/2-oxohepta-3-ene-1,7-dioic acid hydratase in catechol pathway
VLKIAKNGRHVQPEFAREYYQEIAFGIDFTARDLQAELKAKGQPWELAKAFDGSAPLSEFIPLSDVPDADNIEFMLHKNGEAVQHGFTRDVLFRFDALIVFLSQYFKLQMGDLVFTGTPAGVGPVQVGDKLEGFIVTRSGPRRMLGCEIK